MDFLENDRLTPFAPKFYGSVHDNLVNGVLGTQDYLGFLYVLVHMVTKLTGYWIYGTTKSWKQMVNKK